MMQTNYSRVLTIPSARQREAAQMTQVGEELLKRRPRSRKCQLDLCLRFCDDFQDFGVVVTERVRMSSALAELKTGVDIAIT